MAMKEPSGQSLARGVYKVTWTPLVLGDWGRPVSLPYYAIKTVQVRGTPGTSTGITIRGRNHSAAAPTFGVGPVLHDLDGANLSGLTDNEAEGIAEATMQEIWPEVEGGDGATSWTVEMVCQGT